MSRSSNVIQASWDALKKIRNTSPNLLNRKEQSIMSSLMTGNLQWATIQSYVTAFADGILPPFIHWSCAVKSLQSQNTEHSDLPEALANCRSVVEMYLKKTPASNPLALKTFLLEVQRIYDEVSHFFLRNACCSSKQCKFRARSLLPPVSQIRRANSPLRNSGFDTLRDRHFV